MSVPAILKLRVAVNSLGSPHPAEKGAVHRSCYRVVGCAALDDVISARVAEDSSQQED